MLRSWEVRDAPLLKAAIDASLPELRPWMPWAAAEPSPLEAIEARIVRWHLEFAAGAEYVLGIFDPAEHEVLGGTGYHATVDPDALEIGYWIRSDATGRGLATEAARELTRAAFEEAGAERVEIRCDPANHASAAVPRRLGYRLRGILSGNEVRPDGEPRDTMVWELTRAAFDRTRGARKEAG